MKWISVKNKSFQIKKNYPYLVYGHQLNSHMPGKAIAYCDGKEWRSWNDHSDVYRAYEIDCYMDVMAIPHPKIEEIL